MPHHESKVSGHILHLSEVSLGVNIRGPIPDLWLLLLIRERAQQSTGTPMLQQLEISNATTRPASLQERSIATDRTSNPSAKKRRIAPEPLAPRRQSEPLSGGPPEVSCPDTSGGQFPSSREGGRACSGSDQGATTSAEAGADSDNEDASPLLQRGLYLGSAKTVQEHRR